MTHGSNIISRKIKNKQTNKQKNPSDWKSKNNLLEFEEYSKRSARGTFIALNVHSRKDERFRVINLSFHLETKN